MAEVRRSVVLAAWSCGTSRANSRSLGFLYPQTLGCESFVVATTSAAKQKIAAKGIDFRMRLPYRAPTKLDVRLNGRVLKPVTADGCESCFADANAAKVTPPLWIPR